MKQKIILICTPLTFYGSSDEEMFFEWLKRIPSVISTTGIGRELHITCASQCIPDEDLLALMALFSRYGFDQEQLHIFKNKKNAQWFE